MSDICITLNKLHLTGATTAPDQSSQAAKSTKTPVRQPRQEWTHEFPFISIVNSGPGGGLHTAVRCNPCSVYSGKPVMLENKRHAIVQHSKTKKHCRSVEAKGALVQPGVNLQQMTIPASFQQQAQVCCICDCFVCMYLNLICLLYVTYYILNRFHVLSLVRGSYQVSQTLAVVRKLLTSENSE